jgi:hypothetical protein
LVILLMRNNGTSHRHWQYSSWAAVGPFNVIGNFSHEQQWAHSMSPVCFLTDGLSKYHWQHFPWATMGPIPWYWQPLS